MEVVRVGAVNPPAGNRSQWARDQLCRALDLDLAPLPVPIHEVESFTATMSPALSLQLRDLALKRDLTVPRLTAGLFKALEQHLQASPGAQAEPTAHDSLIIGQEHVRDVLHPLLEKSAAGMEAGKIVFAEAATGTGKGRMIASLAANAAAKGDTVVISAPLAVTWQLVEALSAIPEACSAGITMSLGRPNFVSPERVSDWAADNGREKLLEWVQSGGKPLTSRTIEASAVIDHELCWMLEDALALAEDMPVDALMLSSEDTDDCPAQQLYRAMRGNHTEAGIVLCSHFMLANHVRLMRLRGLIESEEEEEAASLSLPQTIDTLIVDEAHLLEQAFASIFSQTLRVRPLLRAVEGHAAKGRKVALAALNAVEDAIGRAVRQSEKASRVGCQLADVPEVEASLRTALTALEGISLKVMDSGPKVVIRSAIRAMKDALSGRTRLSMELTPIRYYPMLVSGRANLGWALESLWNSCVGATLVSATLYSSDDNPMLTRWKLEVPPVRALYLPSVHPEWTTTPVTYMRAKNTIAPDDTPQWADETSELVLQAAEQAAGGTLVLCTSYLNADQLRERLQDRLGERLVIQSRSASASMCVSQYKALYRSGMRPVWVGLGAAWTGIDLSDEQVEAADDAMLSDLVITRLPVGLNRSLTHERRHAIAGFKITSLEGAWALRQGLGRLVRRPGVQGKNLWVLDARLSSKEPWVAPYNKLLSRYRLEA